jgi:hypothetical protein
VIEVFFELIRRNGFRFLSGSLDLPQLVLGVVVNLTPS